MNYPIGTPFILITNPFLPETSSFFGIVLGGPKKGLLPFGMSHYEIEYISSNVPGFDKANYNKRNLVIDTMDLEKAIKNYEEYVGIRKS